MKQMKKMIVQNFQQFRLFDHYLYDAVTGITQVNWFHRPRTIPAQIFLSSYAIFSLLMVCAYQAQLTAILTRSEDTRRVAGISSYQDVISRGGAVCVPGTSQWYIDYFSENYPHLDLYTQCMSVDECVD